MNAPAGTANHTTAKTQAHTTGRTADRVALALLCVFVFTIPWEKGVYLGALGTIAKASGLAAFAAGVVVVVLRFIAAPRRAGAFPEAVTPPPFAFIAAALFVTWSALTWIWSLDQQATVSRVATLAQLLGMLWLIVEFVASPWRQRLLLQFYLAGAVTGAAIAFARYASNLQTYYKRYAAAGFDPNTFGVILALSVPLALHLAFTAKGAMRWVYHLSTLLVLGALLLTGSRAAFLAALLAFAYPLLRWRTLTVGNRCATCVLFAMLLLSLAPMAPSPSRERLSTIPGELTRGTLNSRKVLWKGGLLQWVERPLQGVGAGAYPTAIAAWLNQPKVPGFLPVAHNTFLSVLVECGLMGFGCFGLLLLALCLNIWMMQAPDRALWMVMLLVWAAGVSTLTWEHHKVTWLLFGLITSVSGSAWWRRPSA
jgi:O-antigen ligase